MLNETEIADLLRPLDLGLSGHQIAQLQTYLELLQGAGDKQQQKQFQN